MARPRKIQDLEAVMIACETGFVTLDGQSVPIRRGITRAHAGSDIVRLYPQFFEPIDVHYPMVEQATAAPGERRGS